MNHRFVTVGTYVLVDIKKQKFKLGPFVIFLFKNFQDILRVNLFKLTHFQCDVWKPAKIYLDLCKRVASFYLARLERT